MHKNVFLTSAIAVLLAMPAFAEIVSNATCNIDNLGQSENNSTANVEATWTPNVYTVNYFCGSGQRSDLLACDMVQQGGDPDVTSCFFDKMTYGASATIRYDSVCENTGHTFSNWSCVDSNNNIITFTSEQTINEWNIASNLTCTAQWDANTININWYNQNTLYDQNYCTYDDTITLPAENPTRPGYIFKGWRIKPCSSYDSVQTCPTNRCSWNSESNTCVDMNASGMGGGMDEQLGQLVA